MPPRPGPTRFVPEKPVSPEHENTSPGEREANARAAWDSLVLWQPGYDCSKRKVKSERWYRRRQSIAATVLDKSVDDGNYSISEDLFRAGGEVGPFRRSFRRFLFRDNTRDQFVALAQLDGLPRHAATPSGGACREAGECSRKACFVVAHRCATFQHCTLDTIPVMMSFQPARMAAASTRST